jgi:uncharacterized membrane protein
MNSIPLLKVLFTVAVTTFVGDIILMLIWKLRAERTRDPKTLLFANQTVIFTDNLLLGPFAMLTAISANLLAPRLGINIYATPSLSIAMGMFILSGMVWGVILVPTQKKQLKTCLEADGKKALPEAYFELAKRWTIWGYIAAALVVASLILTAIG